MHVDLKVGLKCNNECVHCIMQPIKKMKEERDERLEAPLGEVIGLIDNAKKNGCSSITLTGGEITLREDFIEILRHALESQLQVTIQTNGRLLSQPHNRVALKELASCGNLQFVVALHGSITEKHDRITGREGSFHETLAGIRTLKDFSIPVVGKIVISSMNYHDLIQTLSLFAALGVDEAVVAFPHAEDFTDEMFSRVVPRYTILRDVLALLCSGKVALPARVQLETIPYCAIPSSLLWGWSIDIEYAMDRISGPMNMIEMAMDGRKIDWSISRVNGKLKGPSCERCLMDYLCEGPWREYTLFYGFEELVPIQDRKVVDDFIRQI